MNAVLKRLTKRIPPPAAARFGEVNWNRLESAIGLNYPTSFREFVGLYGGSVWFDNVAPFYTEANTDVDVKEFFQSLRENLNPLKGNMYDEHFKQLNVLLYPEEGGLFPFMVDYTSNLFCWRTDREDPNKWPVVCWLRGPLIVMERMTISKMILDFLDRKPRMIKIWGDINLYEPERIGLTEV